MFLVLDEVDNSVYGDVIITPKEFERMRYGEMIDGCFIFQKKRFYIGVRLQGLWDNEEKDVGQEKNIESDERI